MVLGTRKEDETIFSAVSFLRPYPTSCHWSITILPKNKVFMFSEGIERDNSEAATVALSKLQLY